jgi:hypothetical protein
MNRIKSLVASVTALAVGMLASATAFAQSLLFGPPSFRARTCDVAIGYRMQAGFPGDVNRTHPVSIMPGLTNTTTPPRHFGDALLVNTADNTYKGVVAGDNNASAAVFAGVCVRSYPTQQSSGGMSSSFGTAVPPASGVMDVCREGYIFVKIPPSVTVTKGGTPYVWCAADSGNHLQGAFEGAASAGNTVPVANARFTGPADATGVVELEIWAA